jgi:hypothetical protein
MPNRDLGNQLLQAGNTFGAAEPDLAALSLDGDRISLFNTGLFRNRLGDTDRQAIPPLYDLRCSPQAPRHRSYFLAATFCLAVFSELLSLSLSNLSSTAATISGNPTVASTNTSPNLPPSAGGTNFPHEIASL